MMVPFIGVQWRESPAAVIGIPIEAGAAPVGVSALDELAHRVLARTIGAVGEVGGTDNSTSAAVRFVKVNVRAYPAVCKTRCAVTAYPPAAVRGRSGANVSTCAAVVGIGSEQGAAPVAVDGARNTVVGA